MFRNACWRRLVGVIFSSGLIALGASGSAQANPGWSSSPDVVRAIAGFSDAETAATLQTGKILVVGRTGAETYDPASGTWAPAGNVSIVGSAATTLTSGKVLVTPASGGTSSGLVYDPTSGRWSYTGPVIGNTYCFAMKASALLPSGQVLAVGSPTDTYSGCTNVAELYDPTTNSWSAATPPSGFIGQLTTLRSGKVLANDGQVFDPSTGTWSAITAGPVPMGGNATMTSLPAGDVLVIGPTGNSSTAAAIYQPKTDSWSGAGSLPALELAPAMTLLTSGKVLVAGGTAPPSWFQTDAAYLFDPKTETWTPEPPLHQPASWFLRSDLAVALDTGDALVVGGQAYPEIFHPNTNIPTARLRYPAFSYPTGGTPFAFNGSLSSDPNSSLASWSLNFGDGTPPASGSGAPPANIQHTYGTGGDYQAVLTVTGSTGLTDTSPHPAFVAPTPTTLTADPVVTTATPPGSAGLLTAHLSVTYNHAPLSGRYVIFSAGPINRYTGQGPTVLCTTITDDTGSAFCDASSDLAVIVQNQGYHALFRGDYPTYQGSWADGGLAR